MLVPENGLAGPKDHRSMAINERREGELRRFVATRRKPLQQLAIGQSRSHTVLEEAPHVRGPGTVSRECHMNLPRPLGLSRGNKAGSGRKLSRIFSESARGSPLPWSGHRRELAPQCVAWLETNRDLARQCVAS